MLKPKGFSLLTGHRAFLSAKWTASRGGAVQQRTSADSLPAPACEAPRLGRDVGAGPPAVYRGGRRHAGPPRCSMRARPRRPPTWGAVRPSRVSADQSVGNRAAGRRRDADTSYTVRIGPICGAPLGCYPAGLDTPHPLVAPLAPQSPCVPSLACLPM